MIYQFILNEFSAASVLYLTKVHSKLSTANDINTKLLTRKFNDNLKQQIDKLTLKKIARNYF